MSARRHLRLLYRAAPALGLCALGAACVDDDVSYQGSLAEEIAAPEPVAYECEPTPSACPGEAPSYSGEIAGIFERHCGACHIEGNLGGPWPFRDWHDISDWALSIRISLEECLMPPPESDAPLSPADRETLQTWLACGAPDN